MDREGGGTAHQHGGQRKDVVESGDLGRGAGRGGALEPRPPACAATRADQIEPMTATPVSWPRRRVIVSSPLATPEYWAGAAPMIALLLGDWSTPMPTPIGIHSATIQTVLSPHQASSGPRTPRRA